MKFRCVVHYVENKKQSPYNGDWLFGRVQGYWDGKKADIYALSGSTPNEIALAMWHEKAHAHLKHPAEFSDIETELIGEAKAWMWTYKHLPKQYRTKHILEEIVRVTEL